ncbi:3-phenylpropionate/trans-cinnamate dioxygenase ferredoxin reductase subunit [Microbacterium trichothecenolyticum]|uniref:NAD(P)/FAD-dependent oxidoreductase n=1 Tax=Microbacterium trichothecenolyticum TaxID=69370 RepID=UPI002855EC60|nr:FAD-dependent oxidoreductase [Microbacterium trichothecenolyticum]MDR7111361.1 3-phenylpropionate/trans-cinnamate dioxygenase ferredoxin reductase subunit [Microbacterium trichothecenolyticum]
MSHMLIIGGGLAGGTAAEALRNEGFDGDITVVTAEAHPPYQRPPLSKGYLAGTEDLDAVVLHPAEWYEERGIRLITGVAVTSLEPAAHAVELEDGERLTYDAVLLATGATPRMIPLPGHDLPGVMTLRRLDDSDELRAQLRDGGKRLVVIGAGWIGMEVAATARGFGNEVAILERDAVPLAMALGAEMGEVFRTLHLEHGVDLRTSVDVDRIVGDGRAEGVVVDGETLPADLVLVGVGASPNTVLAEEAGLDILNGVLTDEALRTSAADVYAAGDIANAFHPVLQRHLRSEHWANALNAGKVAARSMLGQPASFDDIPYFYTDQYDLGMELSGYAPLMTDAEIVVRGDLDAREFIAIWVDDGRIVAGMNVNVWDVNDKVQDLIRSGARIAPDRLRDPEVPLEDLIP